MPNPKRKTSKTRRDKRRTHYKATAKQLHFALQPANITSLTVPSGMKVNFTIMVRL